MIEADHLSKIYGTTSAIQDVTFSVEKGEILGFLGPNGAGKTTTMRILTGYLPATSGTARIAGFDVHENSMAVRQRIGYLPENPPLYTDMSVEGYLHFVGRLKGVPAGDRPTRVKLAMKRCGLLDKKQVLIRKLSKGYRQRVGIAQAIVHDPPAIILDEPTVGLDPRQIIEVRNLIKSLAGEHTIILSTHILPEVSMTCSRVAIINRGRVVAMNTPDQLMAQLAGGAGYELEVEGDSVLVQRQLEQLPFVKAIDLLSDEALPHAHHRYRITLDPEQQTGQSAGREIAGREIAAAIVSSGWGLHEMRRVQVSLEEVFLELTTEETIADETSTEISEESKVPEESSQDGASDQTIESVSAESSESVSSESRS
ncbi:ABC transporter ATP-binding protein [Leptolyngbya ohadii]|uniref:ABC transporter ATP-binding protein n=1 Tax=Leptolyngbya ohadii TaxID=1962290 RepID=UPI000B59A358|nr:ABC transporter ATP-binding protein [Leptolyngbya ohadii]